MSLPVLKVKRCGGLKFTEVMLLRLGLIRAVIIATATNPLYLNIVASRPTKFISYDQNDQIF